MFNCVALIQLLYGGGVQGVEVQEFFHKSRDSRVKGKTQSPSKAGLWTFDPRLGSNFTAIAF
jgi:hypothetical protein